MTTINDVRVFNSKVNYHNGEDMGPGLAVLVDLDLTESQTWQVADKIRNALEGVKLIDE